MNRNKPPHKGLCFKDSFTLKERGDAIIQQLNSTLTKEQQKLFAHAMWYQEHWAYTKTLENREN